MILLTYNEETIEESLVSLGDDSASFANIVSSILGLLNKFPRVCTGVEVNFLLII